MQQPISDLVLYKNNQLLALNKPNGLGVQPDRTTDKSLLDLAEIYTSAKIHVIHRIDRPASGVVLLAKNKKAVAALNAQIREGQVEKTYLAIVAEPPQAAEGELVHYLRKNGRTNRSEAFDKEQKGTKKAVLKYRLLGSSDRYHLLEINLITGRHHQIRAQLAAVGSPIRGDDKYGFRRGNRDRSIQLHAWKIGFRHPVSQDLVQLTAPPPTQPVWQAFSSFFD